ncbi:hypothetical protein [Dechloromonas sp. HYN0024]|uniref:hypothetical protein n=1 Tax=Dechloromonas sp. HYN0024 TaxID=2231055 RepID=UPI000E4536C1|nr:hypothetical protein [Dechloromonas sp. HYN0024]AXS79864.1 hypothetical protein HYN24_07440 [Dechloromonas sp. HYN0024]
MEPTTVTENPKFMEVDTIAARAAEIDQLAGVTDPAAPAAEAPADIQPPPDYYREASQAVEMIAAIIVGYCPDCAPIWDSETKNRVSAALAPVLEKYGVNFGNMPPELMLVIVAGPLLFQTAKTVAAFNIAQKAIKDAQEQSKTKDDGKPMVIRPTGDKDKPETPNQMVHSQMALYN